MKEAIRIIIADDHPIVRQGLRQSIEADPRLVVVAEAGDGVEALASIEEFRPDVVVLDVDMPTLDGFGAAREIKRRGLDVKIVFLTIHRREDLFRSALELGACGYILKESALFEIVGGIVAVAEGNHFVSPSLTSFLVKRERNEVGAGTVLDLSRLTPTELKIVRMIAEYMSSKDIAGELNVHYRTVENHRTNICQKLGLQGHNSLLKFAIQNKNDLQ